ncbi:hypothetical protein GCK32_013161 [Trichostrongylus colubriformis]|uniref:Uncharacterized protein n=1 Tax=Trichostrongylus colubriformis TaxID=6319 RepID=A0AAN8FRI8_TRICO
MESVRTFSSTVHEFWRGVVEWRSPASGPYLMLVNVAFWATCLYCSELVQLRILLSLAAGVVSWDVLLSPTHERSIATHVALWPVQSIWRTLSVCGCLYSSHLLKMQELETACIAAYATVGCLLVNPVWNYYEVNQKIVHGSKFCGQKVADALTVVVLRPLQSVYRAVKYVVLLQFIPPLWKAVKSGVCQVGAGIKQGAIYVVTAIRDFVLFIYTSVKNFVLGVCCAIRNFVLGTWNYFKNLISRVGSWISISIIEPTKNFFYAVGRWLRYWLCAHWWPDLKMWIKQKIGEPLLRAFNYICYGLVYVFCGRWLPALRAWMGGWLLRFKDFAMIQLCALGSFLHRTVLVPTKNYLWKKFDEFRGWMRRCLHRIAVAIRDSVLWPICVLIVNAGRELSLLMYHVLLEV